MSKLDGRKLDHKTLEEIRVRAVHAVQGGQHPEEVVRALGLGKRGIYNWLAAYRSGGVGALKAKKLLGQPMRLRPEQLKSLYGLVAEQTPLQHRFEFALWTLDVARWLINLTSAINNLGQMRFMLTESHVHNEVYIEFLKRLLVRVPAHGEDPFPPSARAGCLAIPSTKPPANFQPRGHTPSLRAA